MNLRVISEQERARNIIECNLRNLSQQCPHNKCKACANRIGDAECEKCEEWWWERARLALSDIVIKRLQCRYTPARLDEIGYVAQHVGVLFAKKNLNVPTIDVENALKIFRTTQRLSKSYNTKRYI